MVLIQIEQLLLYGSLLQNENQQDLIPVNCHKLQMLEVAYARTRCRSKCSRLGRTRQDGCAQPEPLIQLLSAPG